MFVNKPKTQAVLCALFFAFSCASLCALAGEGESTSGRESAAPALQSLLPAETAAELLQKGRIQHSFYGEKNVTLGLYPDTELCKKAAFSWDKENEPVFIVESLYLIPKTGGGIDEVSAVLRNLSTMTGIQYYSTSRSRWETLYTDVHTVNNPEERKTIPDPVDQKGDGLVSFVYQKDRSLNGCVYRFSYAEDSGETAFRAVNTEKLVYKGFNIVKPGNLVLSFNAVETEDSIVCYILIQADAAKIPFVSDRLAKSYGSRADAVYNWCLSEYKSRTALKTGD